MSTSNTEFYYTEPRCLELLEQPLSEPKPGYVQCKSLASLVSIGTEMICYARDVQEDSHWDEWIQYPFAPGYLSVGEITKINAEDSAFTVGQRVCSYSEHKAFFNDKLVNVFPIPDEISNQQAVWFGLNNIVQNGIRHVQPVMGETAVVIGLGPLGQLAVRLLQHAGLKHLIAIEPSAHRCRLAEGNGPTHIVCGTCDDAAAIIQDLTHDIGADMVFDMTGHPAVFQDAQRLLRPLGRLGLIGDVPDPSQQCLNSSVIRNSISIIASHALTPPQKGNNYYRWGKEDMTDYFFELIKSGRLDVDGLNTRVLNPADAPAFYEHLLHHREQEMGVIIDWQQMNS